ncbi:MAG: hypothetical protein JWM80_6372 [Cyanobacteria bacterium RYN_339]|nr:hypothetical protein [Cyanobacteria bacterium RYN_339]
MLASIFLAQVVLPAAVTAELGHFQPAQPEDFTAAIRTHAAAHPSLQMTRGLIAEDLNGDGKPDYAVLAVDRKTREFRFVFAVSAGDGYAIKETRKYRGAFEQKGGIVYTVLGFKPAGQDLWASRLYSPLAAGTPERAAFVAAPALALWRSIGLDPYGRPDDYEVETLSYCSDVYYWVGGQPRAFMVCH